MANSCGTECTGNCGDNCSDYCTGGCGNTCSGGCFAWCSDTCEDGCTGSCQGTCDWTCVEICREACGGACDGECMYTCTATCRNDCSLDCTDSCEGCSACTGACSGSCDNACSSTERAEVIKNLRKNFVQGNVIFSNDFWNLNDILIKDMTRRKITIVQDVGSEIVAYSPILKSQIQAIYNNLKKSGYTNNEIFNSISALQLSIMSSYVQNRANIDLKP